MLKTTYTDGGKEQAGFAHERNDCAVRALALSTGIPYAKAHDLLKAEGRKDRRGTKTWMTERALKKSGAQVELLSAWVHRTATLAEAVRTLRNGRYLIIVRGHALALIDGVIHDAGDISDARCRVRQAWRITPPTPAPKAISQTDINAMWERLNKIKF